MGGDETNADAEQSSADSRVEWKRLSQMTIGCSSGSSNSCRPREPVAHAEQRDQHRREALGLSLFAIMPSDVNVDPMRCDLD